MAAPSRGGGRGLKGPPQAAFFARFTTPRAGAPRYDARRVVVSYLSVHIRGVPYGKRKTRGDRDAPDRWTDAVIARTKRLPKVSEARLLKATFLLPPDKYPSDLPY